MKVHLLVHRLGRSFQVPLILATLALAATPAMAQSGGLFEIRRSTIDGGGITPKSQAGFVVRGTIGQPDPGTLAGDTFQINGGFWLGGLALGSEIFSDGFETGDTSRWTLTVPLTTIDQTEDRVQSDSLPALELRDLSLRAAEEDAP
ncbi:MAG: hypothetical protein K0U98_12415 [Deltaproteobacteria bacterium]|nr:hypothetical protein [Deltaproteobacteria bacterium]